MPSLLIPGIAAVSACSILALSSFAATTPRTEIRIDLRQPGTSISTDLVGAFFEDINFSADGGLYAELIQNRSFEYNSADNPSWHGLTGWEIVQRDGGIAELQVDSAQPLHANNPHYLSIGIGDKGMAGVAGSGYDGLTINSGEQYRLSLFARQLAHKAAPLLIRLETSQGQILDEVRLPALTTGWKKYEAVLHPAHSAADARLLVLSDSPGRFCIDMISLFPKNTFRDRANGMRQDLGQAIADLRPRFMRFPGGCIVHGNGLDNMYRWKDTIGPVETRRSQRNLWKYNQGYGLGYFEYFQFCEDIGAIPIPVVPAAVCCQGSSRLPGQKWGVGQQALPIDDMEGFIQDILDLIEWANGPESSAWGALRVKAGHPGPFNLKYIGVGNEDAITPEFVERFKLIERAIRQRYPDITVIGTAGFRPDGSDFDKGWALARELGLKLMDEHFYRPPQWFWDNLSRYDNYDRHGAKVYVGEYAAHDKERKRTVTAALAEAAFLTSLERNGDVVCMASYAPLLARKGHTQWDPNLIYFDATSVSLPPSYQVQRLFSLYSGDRNLTCTLSDAPSMLACSAVRAKSGGIVLKVVNGSRDPRHFRLMLQGLGHGVTGNRIQLTRSQAPQAPDADEALVRNESRVLIRPSTDLELPGESLTVFQFRPE